MACAAPVFICPSTEFNVFHQRYIGKAAHGFENMTTDKYGLISSTNSGKARTIIHHTTHQPCIALIMWKSHIKPPANIMPMRQSPLNHVFGIVRQLRIGMYKEENIRRGLCRTGIHLSSTSFGPRNDSIAGMRRF